MAGDGVLGIAPRRASDDALCMIAEGHRRAANASVGAPRSCSMRVMETSHTEVEARLLDAALPARAIVLEVGCGRTSRLAGWRERIAELVGVDVDGQAGLANTALDRFVTADICAGVPLPDASVDVVYANFVIEHLRLPGDAFRELHRVLRPRGLVVLLTSNIADPLVWLAARLPRRFVVALKRAGAGVREDDVVPTAYLANTPELLDAELAAAGFAPVEVHFVATLHRYAGRWRALAAALTVFERLLPARRRSTIVALYARE